MAYSSFTRSNVNEKTLQISAPGRSAFDLGSTVDCSLPLGRFIPVRCEHLLPSAVLVGSISPEMTLKEIGTPAIGPLRLDTHTIAVSRRRINKDWVKLVKGDSSNGQPSYFADKLFANILEVLISTDHVVSVSSRRKLSTLLKGLYSGTLPTSFNNGDLIYRLLNRAASFYYNQINAENDLTSYNKDFYMFEHLRLVRMAHTFIGKLDSTSFHDYSVFDAIYEIMKPYFGEGSIMDHSGFPCFFKYGRAMSYLSDLRAQVLEDTWKNFSDATLTSLGNLTLDSLFRVKYAKISNPVSANPSFSYQFADEKYFEFAEWDIRAPYAAWFDSLRNWHIEESYKLPNPDDWATQSIFYFTAGITDFTVPFGRWCCFLIPRFRNYQNDLYSTIQTDDAFRHIFAPIMQGDGAVKQSDGLSVDSYDNILSLINSVESAVGVLFPFGFFNRSAFSEWGESSVYAQDLQTMRRAGMIERYCARNYFFPDTYEGRMNARYGISASDLLGVTSKYIEGGESFITGEQTINNTETEQMPAGSRTFQGGSAITGDTFSFAAGGDDVILVTFVSWMPLVTYSAANPHMFETLAADIVAPEFANDTRVQIQAMNLVRDMEQDENFIGFVPRYVTWRARLNEVHGEFLTDKRSFVWLRDYRSTLMFNGNGTIAPVNYLSQFGINAYDLRVRMNLDAFLELQPWDAISYGRIKFNYSVDNPLPAAIEFI